MKRRTPAASRKAASIFLSVALVLGLSPASALAGPAPADGADAALPPPRFR